MNSPTLDRSATTHRVPCRHGDVTWREAGAGQPIVLLHGIGSAAASWDAVMALLAPRARVLAWDAPGYAESAPLAAPAPTAADYAAALAESLRHLQVSRPVVVGHSLGALMAAAWAGRDDADPLAVVLASPARGYGHADAAVRERKLHDRIALLDRLGIEGLARERAAALCAPGRDDTIVARVRANMARATPGGYRQAASMLAADDLDTRLAAVRAPLAVLCGALDTITPPDEAQALAQRAGAPFTRLPGLAHACYVEDPAAFVRALLASWTSVSGA